MSDMCLLSFFVGLDSCHIAEAGDVDPQDMERVRGGAVIEVQAHDLSSVEEKVKVAEYAIGGRG